MGIYHATVFTDSLTLIPWNIYRKEPLNWQAARDDDGNVIVRAGPAAKQLQIKPKKKLK